MTRVPFLIVTARQTIFDLKPRKNESGQSLTEFALMLPILLLILLGALDLGQLYVANIAIQNAAREGTREGSVNPANNNSLITLRAQKEASNSGINLTANGSVSVTCYTGTTSTAVACSSAALGDTIRVTISYNYPMISNYIFNIGTLPMSQYTEMVIQKIP